LSPFVKKKNDYGRMNWIISTGFSRKIITSRTAMPQVVANEDSIACLEAWALVASWQVTRVCIPDRAILQPCASARVSASPEQPLFSAARGALRLPIQQLAEATIENPLQT
jgi:hypothetical protein